MPYQLSIVSYCLFAFAVAVPCAAAQAQTNGAASAVPGREQEKPTPRTQVEGERIYGGKEVDKKPVIKSKPQPDYPKEAQEHGQEGQVVLRCIFTATGKVTNTHVVFEPGPHYGLTQAAIDAASRIKFKPAMKDGKPVSMWMELQYKFHR
jgi:TonB family protein